VIGLAVMAGACGERRISHRTEHSAPQTGIPTAQLRQATLADVRGQAATLALLATAKPATQVAGIKIVAQRLHHDDLALGIDATRRSTSHSDARVIVRLRLGNGHKSPFVPKHPVIHAYRGA
jgi:hypothetical protein